MGRFLPQRWEIGVIQPKVTFDYAVLAKEKLLLGVFSSLVGVNLNNPMVPRIVAVAPIAATTSPAVPRVAALSTANATATAAIPIAAIKPLRICKL